MEDLLNILKSDKRNNLGNVDAEMISNEYNNRLVFDPGNITLFRKKFFIHSSFFGFRRSKALLFDKGTNLRRRLAQSKAI